MTETAEEMGIEAELQSVPAEAIGGLAHGVSPLEMADAYATLANGGIHHDPTAVSRVEFPNGKVDEPAQRQRQAGADPGPGLGSDEDPRRRDHRRHRRRPAYMGCSSEAGKTGTSEEESDAWFVGYTPMYSTAVWVGHPKSREYTGYGGSTAGPIWQNYMSAAQEGDCPEFEVPTDLPELSPLQQRTHPLLLRSRRRRRRRKRRRRRRSAKKKKRKKKKKEEEAKKQKKKKASPEPAATPPSNPPPAVGVGGGVAPG